GSQSDASDAVQETWLRLSRSDMQGVVNMGGWLTTVVGRVCLDMLRTRTARREDPITASTASPMVGQEASEDPEHEALLADSVGIALLVILETLAPAERLAFVLHDIFDVPFDEIATIVERSPVAARQMASRARRRVQGATQAPEADGTRQREVVAAFLSASREGDFAALLALLAPDVVLRADPAAIKLGTASEVRGAADVASTFAGRAKVAQTALINGVPGAVWAPGGQPRVVFAFTTTLGKIVAIDILADAATLEQLDVVITSDG
ncbi:MAG: sigma-70 family RNA polymerase sigma factor, partial [Ktedonobacterales bacterium]|nr:sigma-70 family RNA polymerase sigma factor [Ktedonobacterales bacterium]